MKVKKTYAVVYASVAVTQSQKEVFKLNDEILIASSEIGGKQSAGFSVKFDYVSGKIDLFDEKTEKIKRSI